MTFRAVPRPTAAELSRLTETLARRVRALLSRRGLLEDDGDEPLPPDDPEAVLAACRAASARGLTALAGRAVRRLRLPAASATPRTPTGPDVAAAGGFNVHVGARVAAWDRERLERLCRYALRPPLAQGRLAEAGDGLLSYELRHAWRDGTHAVLLEPLQLLERLVALVPAPGRNLLRYHGTMAPNARR